MSRVGWVMLGLIVAALAAVLSTCSLGDAPAGSIRAEVARVLPDRDGVLAVPVAGFARGALQDSWGDARGGGTRGHHGTDIPAGQGTPVVAAATGTVEKLFESRLGGTTLYVRSPDRRWIYYYAHLAGYAPGIAEGRAVRRGETIGYVGDTGDAGPGNYHLHFGMQAMRPGERWWQGEDVNPYPLLAGRAAGR